MSGVGVERNVSIIAGHSYRQYAVDLIVEEVTLKAKHLLVQITMLQIIQHCTYK